MEKLTYLDCVLINNINFLRKTKSGPSRIGSSSRDIGAYWFDGEDKNQPIMVYQGDMGNKEKPMGDENAILEEIFARCGNENLEKRIAEVCQQRLYRIWGGREEYYRTFPWLTKGGLQHRDADVVDNACIECGARGLAKGLVRCARCRRGDF
jgi:hypothetical protein